MDPNTTLREIQETENHEELGRLCSELHRWLRKRGFEPEWDKSTEGTNRYETFLVLDQRC